MLQKQYRGAFSRKANRKRRETRLRGEQLEERMVLAGNLDVSFADGLLIIQGDDDGNVASITQLDNERLAVTGFGTTLNNASSTLVFESVDSIFADLRGGDDLLGIGRSEAPFDSVLSALTSTSRFKDIGTKTPLRLPGDLTIIAGPGNDALAAVVKLGGGLSIHADEGNDQVNLTNTSVRESIRITAGAGDSIIKLKSVFARSMVLLNLASGKNVVSIDDVQVSTSAVQTGEASKGPLQQATTGSIRILRPDSSEADQTDSQPSQSNVDRKSLVVKDSGGGTAYSSNHAATLPAKDSNEQKDTMQLRSKEVVEHVLNDLFTYEPIATGMHDRSDLSLISHLKASEVSSQLFEGLRKSASKMSTVPFLVVDQVFVGYYLPDSSITLSADVVHLLAIFTGMFLYRWSC